MLRKWEFEDNLPVNIVTSAQPRGVCQHSFLATNGLFLTRDMIDLEAFCCNASITQACTGHLQTDLNQTPGFVCRFCPKT